MAGNSAAITGLWEGHCLRRRVGNSTARDVAGDAADIFCAACYLAFEDSTVCNCGIQVDGAANTAGYVCGKGKIAHSAV